jgi:arabinofuranan 3-O-arabinosyltransferase
LIPIATRVVVCVKAAPSLPLLMALPACLAPLVWADPGILIQTGDFNNPLNADRAVAAILDGWRQDNLGEPTFRETPFLFPYLLFWWIGQAVGISDPTIQRLWLIALFALAVICSWSLLRLIAPWAHRRRMLATLALVAYVFNPFTLTYWAIGYQIAFLPYAVAPLWLAELTRVLTTRASWTSGVRLALISLLFASGFSNPPSVMIMIILPSVVLAGLLLVKKFVSFRAVSGRLFAAAPWLVLLNVWWLAPALTGVIRGGYSYAGESWRLFDYPTFVNHVSFLEFIRGTGYWGLHSGYGGVPYFSWASYLDEPVVVAATLWLAALALLPLMSRRWWGVWTGAAAIMFVLGVFLSKGVNPPLGDVNRWFYAHVPGFFILRGTEKFAGLQFLSVLIGLGVLLRRWRWRSGMYWPFCAVTTIAIALASWPLISGTVVQPQSRGGVSAEIEVPRYYKELTAWTRGERPSGAILSVPQTPTGYLKTTWGFAGADLIHHYSSAPVVIGAPEARATDGPRFAAYLRAAQMFDQVELLRRLGISHVLVRDDIDENYYSGTPSPTSVETRLKNAGFIWVKTLGPLRIYRVPIDISPVRSSRVMLAATKVSLRDKERLAVESALPIVSADTPLASEGITESCVLEIPQAEAAESRGRACGFEGSELSGEVLFARYSFIGQHDASGAHLSVIPHLPEAEWTYPSTGRRRQSLNVPLDENVTAVRVGSMLLLLRRDSSVSGETGVYPETTIKLLGDGDENLITDGSFEGKPLSGLGHIGPNSTDVSLRVSDDASVGRQSAELHATGGAALLTRAVAGFDPTSAYVVSFDYRHVRGAAPAFGIWQNGVDTYALEERHLSSSPGWHRYRGAFLPTQGARALRLFLYSFARKVSGDVTVNRYDNVVVRRLDERGVIRIGERLGEYAATLDWAGLTALRDSTDPQVPSASPPLIRDGSFEKTPWGGAFPIDPELPEGEKALLSSDASDGQRSLEIIAMEGGAAVSQKLESFDPESRYRLTFRYRHVEGDPPAFGVWATGVEQYAERDFTLSTEPGWHDYQTTISVPAGSKGLSLFFYSFSRHGERTRNRYDKVVIERIPVRARFLIMAGSPERERAPTLALERSNGTSSEGTVRDLDGTVWILFAQAYDRDWDLKAKALNGSAVDVGPHVRVDEFANAWKLSGRGDIEFAITYRAAFPTRAALGVSGSVILILCLVSAVKRRSVILQQLRRPLYRWRLASGRRRQRA